MRFPREYRILVTVFLLIPFSACSGGSGSVCDTFVAEAKTVAERHISENADLENLLLAALKKTSEDPILEEPSFCETFESEATRTSQDETKLSRRIFKSFVANLDAHSNYYLPEELAEHEALLARKTRGPGIILRYGLEEQLTQSPSVEIEEVLPKSPAFDLLKRKDIITHVGGQSISELTAQEIFNFFQRNEDGEIELQMETGESHTFPIIDFVIPITMARVFRSSSGDLGYLLIRSFSVPHEGNGSAVSVHIQRAVEKFESEGIEGLILDLRGNLGGRITEVLQSLAVFEKGEVRFWTKGPKDQTMYQSEGKGVLPDIPIFILTNRSTASAAEIFSGYLSRQRALIIGDRTFGKGTVQESQPREGLLAGLLDLTTEYYFLPGDLNPQLDGFLPHITSTTSSFENALARRSTEKLLLTERDYEKVPRPILPKPSGGKTQTSSETLISLAQEIQTELGSQKAVSCPSPKDCTLDFAIEAMQSTIRRDLALAN